MHPRFRRAFSVWNIHDTGSNPLLALLILAADSDMTGTGGFRGWEIRHRIDGHKGRERGTTASLQVNALSIRHKAYPLIPLVGYLPCAHAHPTCPVPT